jgi:hypothetical protein
MIHFLTIPETLHLADTCLARRISALDTTVITLEKLIPENRGAYLAVLASELRKRGDARFEEYVQTFHACRDCVVPVV